MDKIYTYCECCKNPMDADQKTKNPDSSLDICRDCAVKLLKKIYGKDDKE